MALVLSLLALPARAAGAFAPARTGPAFARRGGGVGAVCPSVPPPPLPPPLPPPPPPSALRSAVSDSDASSASARTTTTTPEAESAAASVLSSVSDAAPASRSWGELFDLSGAESTFHAVFSGIRHGATLGLGGTPFVLRADRVADAVGDMEPLEGFWTYDDLVKAVEADFLDADRGSTDNRRGWKVASVSKPRGDSFEDARMTREEIDAALEKGTVILSAAGAHIPKLAGPTLACTDASSLPCALNLYVTAAGKRTSAPPHTDRQDVAVIQTQGRKRWRVYGPPDPSADPQADMFARGKGDDDVPLFALEEGRFGGSGLLMDLTLEPGDVLFVPAAFPHTTDTAAAIADGAPEATSVHLTFNFDTHVWDLDYLSARRLALRRVGVTDWALGQFGDNDNRYVGRANEVEPPEVREALFRALPLGLLDEDEGEEEGGGGAAMVDEAASELRRISLAIDEETASQVPPEIWTETIRALRRQGLDLMDIHRDMYLAAVEEGRTRRSEEEMTAHLTGEALARARALTPEKMQRMSVFRVREYFAKINEAKEALVEWSRSGATASGEGDGDGDVGGGGDASSALPDNWEFTLPLNVGDEVEADLGGAFFPATVTKAQGSTYNVQFFDGDTMDGLSRDMIRLLNPPAAAAGGGDAEEEEPPPGLTKKELKRWRKKREKKAAKK